MGCFRSKPSEPECSINTVRISDIVINVSNSGSNVQLDVVRRASLENRPHASRLSLDGRFTNNPVIDGILEYQTYGSIRRPLSNDALYKIR